jgi:hypothetical protein
MKLKKTAFSYLTKKDCFLVGIFAECEHKTFSNTPVLVDFKLYTPEGNF